MKAYEAYDYAYQTCSRDCDVSQNIDHVKSCGEALDTLKSLVDRDTAKKVKVIDEPDLHYIYYCPECGSTLMVDRNLHPKHLFNFCGKCGKRLDWGDKE
jgi:hypothetical protein